MGTVVDDLITRVFDEVRSLDEGELADYIPELAAVAPDSFGICIATVDGYVYEIGDSRIPFTIQSISKPFTYAWLSPIEEARRLPRKSTSNHPASRSTKSASTRSPNGHETP